MTKRGFGIAAATLSALIAPLAAAAEANGYDTFWVNDTPGSTVSRLCAERPK